jgi:endonuclease YncB( thermonuclease family)
MPVTWMIDPTEGVPSEQGVHDGDTFHVIGDVRVPLRDVAGVDTLRGLAYTLGTEVKEKVRLAHCNAPELKVNGKPSPLGSAARDAVKQWLLAEPFRMLGYGRDNYGRWLADVQRLSDQTLLSQFVLSLPGSEPMSVRAQLARVDGHLLG